MRMDDIMIGAVIWIVRISAGKTEKHLFSDRFLDENVVIFWAYNNYLYRNDEKIRMMNPWQNKWTS